MLEGNGWKRRIAGKEEKIGKRIGIGTEIDWGGSGISSRFEVCFGEDREGIGKN